MLAQAENEAIQSHQARWDCLAQESSKVPRCRQLARLGPDDADYCDEAVTVCKTKGVYGKTAQADERLSMWHNLAGLVRLAVFASVVCSLVWFGLVRPIRRMTGSTQS
jgi:hypothetical protein